MNFKSFITASAALVLCQGVVASAVRRWETAGPSCPDFTPFVYEGCFYDPSSPRALPFSSSSLNTQNMTVEICVAFCKGANPCLVYGTVETNLIKRQRLSLCWVYHKNHEREDRTTNMVLVSNIMGNVSAELLLQAHRFLNRIAPSHVQAIHRKYVGAMTSCRFTETRLSLMIIPRQFPTTSLRDAGPTTAPVAGLLYICKTLIRRT